MSIRTFLLGLLLSGASFATVIPSVSVEELVRRSDRIVFAHVIKTWTAWDSAHQYIWTRYELAVDQNLKGSFTPTVVVSEPGGVLEGIGMRVEGAVSYQPGETVALFLRHYPTGENRTIGWAQGKLHVDAQNRVHPISAEYAVSSVQGRSPMLTGTPVSSLDGLSRDELVKRVRATLLGGGTTR